MDGTLQLVRGLDCVSANEEKQKLSCEITAVAQLCEITAVAQLKREYSLVQAMLC